MADDRIRPLYDRIIDEFMPSRQLECTSARITNPRMTLYTTKYIRISARHKSTGIYEIIITTSEYAKVAISKINNMSPGAWIILVTEKLKKFDGIECRTYDNFNINPFMGTHSCKHEILSQEAAEKIKVLVYGAVTNNRCMMRISSMDPTMIWLGGKSDDVIEITRSNGSKIHRVVSDEYNRISDDASSVITTTTA
jgi:hypothetical protein